MTPWWHYLVAVVAPLFLVNSIPHLVSGLLGRKFPTPFVGGPPNLDSAPRNIIWGGANLLIGGGLFWLLGDSVGNPIIIVEMIVLAFAAAFGLSRIFSGLH